MVSDIGLVPSIVNTKRDKEVAFMATAWSIQLIRSLILAAVLVVAAWPVSLFYDQPILAYLVLVTAASTVLSGFNSIGLILEQKYLRQKRLALLEISVQTFSILSMIVIAYYTRSIWALILGQFIAVAVKMIASHKVCPTNFMKFTLERDAVLEIVHFGKWILLASLFGYFVARSSPMIMGKFIGMDLLGMFVIARMFAAMAEMVVNGLSDKILQPRYRQMIVGNTTHEVMLKFRYRFNLIFLPVCIVLATAGQWIIDLLYDDRYTEAGWVLQILSIGRVAAILSHSAKPILTSLGDSKTLMFNQGFSAILTFSLLSVAGYTSGFEGMVLASITLSFLNYGVLAFSLSRKNIHIFLPDIVVAFGCVAIMIIIWWLLDAKPLHVLAQFLGF